MTEMEWTVIVPARGGSVGIAGKNRRYVGDVSLVERAIRRALLFAKPERVFVSSDDTFALNVAYAYGCSSRVRPADLCGSETTIAEVVHDVVQAHNLDGPIAVCQPTSPTLCDETVLEAVGDFAHHPEWDSLALVTDDPHLMWRETANGRVEPIYDKRVNRQYRQDHVWRETGGLSLVRAWSGPASMIGSQHHLWPVTNEEALDVDVPLDLATAAASVNSRVIEWRVVAGETVGYGHLYRSLALAAEMPHHDHRWVVDGPEAARVLVGDRYPVAAYGHAYETAADVVVFDCLNVDANDYDRARMEGAIVVGIELTEVPGYARFDLYMDELSGRTPLPVAEQANLIRTGPLYASIRDEFRAARLIVDTGAVDNLTDPTRILVTFGGEDPEHFTARVLSALPASRYNVSALIGPGFSPDYAYTLRSAWPDQVIEAHAAEMSALMLASAVVVTSTGRTVWEAASLGCSILTIPVNERERDHGFPWAARRLPGHQLDDGTVRLLVDAALMDDHSAVARAERADASGVDGRGPRRFAWLVDGLIGNLI